MRQVSMLQSPAIALMALVLITLVVYHKTVASLIWLWTEPDDPTYHHGPLLVGVCAFLFYRRWGEVKSSIQVRPSLSAPLLVLLASLGWLLASMVSVLIVQQLSLVLLVGLLVVSLLGYRSAWLFAFPVALLIFALPIWGPLSPYLQRLTAHSVTFLLNLTGISAFLEGTEISVSAGSFNVAPGCSGIAQLVVGTMAGALFAYINRLGRKAAFWVVAAAVGVSVLVNTLRVYTVAVAGQLTGMQHYFVTTNHYTLGWVLFGIGMFIYLILATKLIGPSHQAADTLTAQSARTFVTPNGRTGVAQSALLCLCALATGPALVYAYQSDRGEIGRLALDLPEAIAGWRAAPGSAGGYRPVYHNPDLEYERLYRHAEGRPVYLYVAQYVYQEQGKKAVYYSNGVYDNKTWKPGLTRTRDLGGSVTLQETRIRSRTGAEKLVWRWYYVHGFVVSSDYMAKLVNAWGTLRKDPAIAVVVVAADLEGSYESTEALLTHFVGDTKQTIERAIDHAQQPPSAVPTPPTSLTGVNGPV